MLLTSRSPIFSESRDFVTAIFDAQGRLAAQTSYIPVLLGAVPFALEGDKEVAFNRKSCIRETLSSPTILTRETAIYRM